MINSISTLIHGKKKVVAMLSQYKCIGNFFNMLKEKQRREGLFKLVVSQSCGGNGAIILRFSISYMP
jgi:hypothetical protein